MNKIIFWVIATMVSGSLYSCNNDSKCCNQESENIHEGRISTHTNKSHLIHQDITSEERELAKDHINNETAPGVSTVVIDAEGAKMINEHRIKK